MYTTLITIEDEVIRLYRDDEFEIDGVSYRIRRTFGINSMIWLKNDSNRREGYHWDPNLIVDEENWLKNGVLCQVKSCT